MLPCPGFSLYETLASSKGVSCNSIVILGKFYALSPEKQWEINIPHLISQIDQNTACILINNPSNPCGSVYSKQHLLDLLAVAERFNLPIISDEIYADMVFDGHIFFPLATLTNKVPILTCGGLAKRFLVPGWRVGWVLIHDRNDEFSQIRKGLLNLTTLTLGANSLIQAAIPDILENTPDSFHEETMSQLESNAQISIKALSGIPGITLVQPQGAMYLMVLVLGLSRLD